MILIPYRAKNPPERFPWVTLALIAANVLVYAVTADSFVEVRESVVHEFALSHNTLSPLRLVTSLFLHHDPLHLGGNMLFLWLFGPALEGRLRPGKFIGLYMAAGIVGALLHDFTVGIRMPDEYALGASGAIMGVMGGYLYVFPYAMINLLYWVWVRAGIAELQARWVAAAFVGLDIFQGLMSSGMDGVGHAAHLGGFGTGLLMVWALRTRRDSEEMSEVQEHRADTKDYRQLSMRELGTVMQYGEPPLQAIMAYCQRAMAQPGGIYAAQCRDMIARHADLLVQQADPQPLADIVLWLPPAAGGLTTAHCLRLASRLEAAGWNELASRLYYRVYETNPAAPEAETALFRLARVLERAFGQRQQARVYYTEVLRRFPMGPLAGEARRAIAALDGSPVL